MQYIFEMQQENKKLQQSLYEAQRLIQAQQKLIQTLELSVEINKERVEILLEVLECYAPKFKSELDWKRTYLPVYGKITSPPFSKN